MILITEISFVCFICALVVCEGNSCSLHCLNDKCDDTTGTCDECLEDRYGNYCEQECTLCKDEKCDRLHCTHGCKDGYYEVHIQNYSDCYQCLTNCLSCQNPNKCTKCKDGYFIQVITDVHSCEKCNWNCAICSSINECFSCEPGYYGEYCGQSCSLVLPNCSMCSGTNHHDVKCTQCSNGTVLKDNKCEADVLYTCPSNCISCLTDNICESCKDGWYGTRCAQACSDNIDHCVTCLETNGVVTCTACHGEYKLFNGMCVSKTDKPVTSTPSTTGSTPSQTVSVQPTTTTESACVSGNNESFQTSAFAVGIVSGFGICLCLVLLVGLICFLKRRKRNKQDDQATALQGQCQPFYENSITADVLRLKTAASSESQSQENIEQVNVIDDNNTYEDTRQTATGGESSVQIEISSSSNADQHNYTSLTTSQGEHVYRDFTST